MLNFNIYFDLLFNIISFSLIIINHMSAFLSVLIYVISLTTNSNGVSKSKTPQLSNSNIVVTWPPTVAPIVTWPPSKP